MACFRPLLAWQLDGGEIVFKERGKIRRELTLPCGRCRGCRQARVRSWAIRCLHEAQMHSEPSSFVTLTYEGAHDPSLNYRDFQRFMYRLRAKFGPTRFFMCGEYGDVAGRPHFHALLFGRTFGSRSLCGKDLYRSPDLEALWPSGFSSIGDVSYQSASYVASYCVKRLSASDPRFSRRYSRVDVRTGEVVSVVPEFARMSLKPGIGASWFAKYWREVFLARDGICREGKVMPAPRYYLKLCEEIDYDLVESLEHSRDKARALFADDNSPARLATREVCAIARDNHYRSRSL